tara:strand:- start:151 stop:312 length:162 start_codon:yes stop_codon:yes gene_type:complete
MDKNNYKQLNTEIEQLFKNIIFKQNLDLIKKISRDYNRNYNVLVRKYKLGKYN